jgi:hypothetical protein
VTQQDQEALRRFSAWLKEQVEFARRSMEAQKNLGDWLRAKERR